MVAQFNVGKIIRYIRKHRNLTQEDFATLIKVDGQHTVSRIENGRMQLSTNLLDQIARTLGVQTGVLRGEISLELTSPQYVSINDHDNSKPVVFKAANVSLNLNSVFIMDGNHIEPLEIGIRYDPTPLVIPAAIQVHYDKLLQERKIQAREKGYPFFNGPNTRLRRITQENTHQSSNGREQKGVVLELGPVSWFEYTILNEYLDYEIEINGKQSTIRESFADQKTLFDHKTDLRWCGLSSILTLVLTPITKDGYALIQHRALHGVSCDIGKITTINENIHRFLDEASPDNLYEGVNTAGKGHGVDADYRPAGNGVPSPYLTALRGIQEEVSTKLYEIVKQRPSAIKFLDIVFDITEYFQPALVGVVELEQTRAEVEHLVNAYPGIDHSEHRAIDYICIDYNAEAWKKTAPLFGQQSLHRWWNASLAGVVAACEYYNKVAKKRQKQFT